jgi:hypothetical protein
MAKTAREARAELRKYEDKGRAGLAEYKLIDESDGSILIHEFSAWTNPSAAKRWVKQVLSATTPRKSMSFLGSNFNEKQKPMYFYGSVRFKVDA